MMIPESPYAALETGCSLVAIATGAPWRHDSTGRRADDPVPGLAAAVWSGRRFAPELGVPAGDEVPFRRQNVALSPDTQSHQPGELP